MVLGFFLPGLEEACAQTKQDVPKGPTRASMNVGAAHLALDANVSPRWIQYRFDTFQDEFSDDFGITGPLKRGEVVDHLQGEIAAKWGETGWYAWLRRGMALYARFQALTETERSGFDMEVETDDLSQGKVGLRVTRALE